MLTSRIPQRSLRNSLKIGLQRFPHGLDLPLPSYGTILSAGLDLYAAVTEDTILAPQQWQAIPTGIGIAIPIGYEGQIRSRSGLAAKHGVAILNAPGTIDADYRGELIGVIINHGNNSFTITRGMRFAQLVIAPVASIIWEERQILEETTRGTSGFGSTGVK